MNRRLFFRNLILGGIVLPHVPKLIMTGGWFDPYAYKGFNGALDPPLRFERGLCKPLTHASLCRLRDEMFKEIGVPSDILVTPNPSSMREIRALMEEDDLWKPRTLIRP